MNRTITYAVNQDDGSVISRVNHELAWPVYQYADFGNDGDFTGEIPVQLEKISIYDVGREWNYLHWTRKIPAELKNIHRIFWGFPPLPVKS